MELLTPTRRRTRTSLSSKGDVTPTPSKENRQPGSGSASKAVRRSARSPKSPKSPLDYSGVSDDSYHTPPLQENNSMSENLSLSFSTEADSLIGPISGAAAKRMTADPNILKELIDDISNTEKRMSSASKSPRATKSPAKSPGKSSSAKKKQSAKKQQDRRRTVDGTALSSLMNELNDDSVVSSRADISVLSALSPATGNRKQGGNRRHTADPSILRELMEGGDGEDSNDSLSFTVSSSNASPAFFAEDVISPANSKRRSAGMGRHRDSLSNFMAQLESSDEDIAADSDEEDVQSEKRRKSNSGRTPRRETASPGVLEALVHELQNDRDSIEPIALGNRSMDSPSATVTGPVSLGDSSIDILPEANRSMEEERRRTASPGMLMALLDDLQGESQQAQPTKRRRSSAFSPSPRRSKRLLHESPSPLDSLQSLESPGPVQETEDEPTSTVGTGHSATDISGIFAVPQTTSKGPLRGILSSQKKPRPKDLHSHKKSVMFGSPEAAEFVADDPSMSYTPLQKQVAKSLFPMEPTEQPEEEEDEETSYNSHVLEEWDRLSAASDGDGSPLADDDSDDMIEGTPMSTTSSRRSRRRKSMLQPSASKLKRLQGDLDAESEDEPLPASQEDEEPAVASASPAVQPRPSFAPSSVSSLASEDRTANLPGSLADLLLEEQDKFVGRASIASSRLSFLSDDDHTAQLPGNLADLLREEVDASADVSGQQDNTVELETDLASLLNHASQSKPISARQPQPDFQLDDSADLASFHVGGRLSAIAEAAEVSTSDSGHSTSSAAHSRVSTPGSVRSSGSLRSSMGHSAFSPARSTSGSRRQSMSNASGKSPASFAAGDDEYSSFISEHDKSMQSEAEEEAHEVDTLEQPHAANSPGIGTELAAQASLAMLQRLKKLNTESRQASLNVCATPLAGVDPNASRLSISRRLSVMSTNAKHNRSHIDQRSQLVGTSRRNPSWIPEDDSMDNSEVDASVLADNTNIVSHGSPEVSRHVPELTLDEALEWALEQSDDNTNERSNVTFVRVCRTFLERATQAKDAASHGAAELFSSKLFEIISEMLEQLPVDMGTAMESARAAWNENEPGVAVLKSASASGGSNEADALQQVFDGYHSIVTNDWDSWEYELSNLVESEIVDETTKVEEQLQEYREKLQEVAEKREEARKAAAGQKIRQELDAVEAKIAQANAEIAQLRQQFDDVESSKQQLLAEKQNTLEEIMSLPSRMHTSLDETKRMLKLAQQQEKEMTTQLTVRQSLGWWRLHEHRATAMGVDLVVVPNVQYRLEFKFENKPELSLASLSIRQLPSSSAERTVVGLVTALVDDILKGDAGPLSAMKVNRCLEQGWCDPVALLKQVDGFIASTRMIVQQLAPVLSNPACTTRIEKENRQHYLVVEVNNKQRGRNVTLRLPMRSLLSWDRSIRSLGVDCTATHGSVEQVHERVMGALAAGVPGLNQHSNVSLPLCPLQDIVHLTQRSITSA